MSHSNSIGIVLGWFDKKGYVVEFDRSGDDSVDRENKLVSINNTRSLETQLHVMLHEAGHVMVYNSDSIVNGIEEVLVKYSEKSKIHKIENIKKIKWKRTSFKNMLQYLMAVQVQIF